MTRESAWIGSDNLGKNELYLAILLKKKKKKHSSSHGGEDIGKRTFWKRQKETGSDHRFLGWLWREESALLN